MKITIILSSLHSRPELSRILREFATAVMQDNTEDINIFYSYNDADSQCTKFARMEITNNE